MIAAWRSLAVWIFLIAAGPADAAARPSRLPGLEAMKQQAMIFFIAKGAPDSCGPGCSEWIAAEGAFDPDAHQRLREFLALHVRKDMPIFFHSTGGMVGSAILIGGMLRERRMRAGVGQTIPEGCRDGPKADDACRRVMAAGRELKSRLRFNGATCASACAYAFFGAAVRSVAPGVRVGIHASRVILPTGQGQASAGPREDRQSAQARMNAGYDWLRRYTILMGVEAGIIDVAIKTDPAKVRWLSREELSRFGIINDNVFETSWRAFDASGAGTAVIKSISRRSSDGPALLTTTIELGCSASGQVAVSVRRELAGDRAPGLRVTSGADVILDDNGENGSFRGANSRARFVPSEIVHRAASSEAIVLHETMPAGSRETKLSTKGLAAALMAARGGCGGKV